MLEAEAYEQKGWPCPLDSRDALGVPSLVLISSGWLVFRPSPL